MLLIFLRPFWDLVVCFLSKSKLHRCWPFWGLTLIDILYFLYLFDVFEGFLFLGGVLFF